IIPANGGTWSFLDTSGPITEDNGYQNAGAIIAGEYSDAIGGGVCQVATTVFNAVYEAGYPVTQRRNHSLYIASYPEGRDAAIVDSDPRIDLQWKNDTSSDILLVMSYTDSSVTCTLYGVDPGYQVSTEVGEWQEGDKYSTSYVTDDTLSPGDEVIEQYGADGRSISVVRTVSDADGKVLHQETFSSNYSAKDEIIARGPSE
ncbi:MAG: VanW family protein, partial [Streptococcus salivarius]|nr:VanW family protein [Streptococcus salivarius]